MKKILLPILILLLSCTSNPPVQSQPEDTTTTIQVSHEQDYHAIPDLTPEDVKGIPTDIKGIKTGYAYIVSLREQNRLDSISFSYACAENSGTIIYFYENKKLRMIDYAFSEGDHSGGHEQYFIKDTTLFFIYTLTSSWGFEPQEGRSGTWDEVSETRTYIANKQPIRCLVKSYMIHSDEEEHDTGQNEETTCLSYERTITSYQQLLRFRNNPSKDCWEKYAE